MIGATSFAYVKCVAGCGRCCAVMFTGLATTVSTKAPAEAKTSDLAVIGSYFPLRFTVCRSNERAS
jgi:hypothetical protein